MIATVNRIKKFFNVVVTFNKRLLSRKRKYPIDPKEAESLPIFQYTVSKKEYRRVFSWGYIQSGALGIPYLKTKYSKIDEKIFSSFPKRLYIGEKFEVTAAACGFGFTVFAVNSDTNTKIHGTGLNTDSQIGYHEIRVHKPLGVLFIPQPIPLSFKNPKKSKVLKLSAGRAHLLVLTDEGIFTLGNNAYGQCGRKIVPDENYAISNYIHHIKTIDGKKVIDIECGQDHSMAIMEDGSVYSCGWSADGQTGLGHFVNTEVFRKVNGDIEGEKIVQLACRSDFVLALNDKGEVFGWGNTEYSQMTLPEGNQQVTTPTYIKMLDKLGKIKSIANGGSFCVVLNDQSQVYSWGYGLLGVGPAAQQSKVPIRIPDSLFGKNQFQPNSKVVNITCGLNHTMAITNLGDIYAWGRNKYCCLGLGHDRDQYFPLKVAIGGFAEKVYCGIDHSVAICKPFI